jgi:rSAM/selenodomain-associated transferase 1
MSLTLKKALIVFAKNPVPGRVKTRLSPPLEPAAATDLYRCMLGDLLAKASHLTGVDKYLYYEGGADAWRYFNESARGMECRPQQGDDLGGKMAAAFRQLFAEGYGAVAIIGSDSPDLPTAYIEEAFDRLENDGCDAVFGPTEDGGYYLVGMTRLQEDLFRDVSWSSGEVLRESLQKAEQAGITVSLLPPWHDVDTAEDLLRPHLLDEENGAPLTRAFLKNRIGSEDKPLTF